MVTRGLHRFGNFDGATDTEPLLSLPGDEFARVPGVQVIRLTPS